MTIRNQQLTDARSLDLDAFIRRHGAPHYPTQRNPVGTLNERFWAAFLATFNELIYENREHQFYRYGGKIYTPTSEHLLREQLSNDIEFAASTWPNYTALAQLCNARHLSGVLSHLKGKVQMEGVFNQKRNYIHADNGVIMLNGAEPELLPFDPKFVSRNLVPIEYRSGAECPKFTDELLKPLSPDDVWIIRKLFGVFLSGMNFVQKILILQGEPGSGKSVLAALARLLNGAANCEELRVSHLADRFELTRYIAKTLLIGSDVSGDFLNHPAAHFLKKMTGGDIIGLERKFSNAAMSITGTFPVMMTCNSRLVVRLDGDRGAWHRRLVIANYKKKEHVKDIPGFAQKLMDKEGSGILNWALEGLRLANEDVEQYGVLAMTDEQTQRVSDLLDESEGLRFFVKNHIYAAANSDLTTNEIIEKYASFCADPGRQWSINSKQLEKQLANIMLAEFHATVSTNIERDGKNKRGYRGVSYDPF